MALAYFLCRTYKRQTNVIVHTIQPKHIHCLSYITMFRWIWPTYMQKTTSLPGAVVLFININVNMSCSEQLLCLLCGWYMHDIGVYIKLKHDLYLKLILLLSSRILHIAPLRNLKDGFRPAVYVKMLISVLIFSFRSYSGHSHGQRENYEHMVITVLLWIPFSVSACHFCTNSDESETLIRC